MSEAEDLRATTKTDDEGFPSSPDEDTQQHEDQPEDEDEYKNNEDDDQNITGEKGGETGDKGEDGAKRDVKEEANEKNLKDLEKQEELKLRAKYPDMKTHVASSFLQKRLSKGNKYFDSGDYNMAKAKVGSAKPIIGPGQKVVLPGPTGDAIPTPETVPHKKISNVQSKLVNTRLL